jgi:hypothetical protein
MNESEVIRQLSLRTGLPESAAEAVLLGLRGLVRDGEVDGTILSSEGNVVLADAPFVNQRLPVAAPEDPRLVDEVIARARRHPLGLQFLLSGLLTSVAAALGAHAFTVEAARSRLRKQEKLETKEPELV